MVPAQTGNGLAMRCGMFLEALHLVGNVELLVVPISSYRDANAISYARKLCSRLMMVETTGRKDTLLEMIVRTSDEDNRLEMFARYGLPSICGHLSSSVIREACDLVAELSYDMTVMVRNHSGPLLASVQRKTRTGRLLIDLDDDDGAFHRELAAALRASGDEAEARWNELEADAFDRLTIDNAGIADLTSVSNQSHVLPLSQRTMIKPPVVIPNSITMKEPFDHVSAPTMIMVGTLNYKPNTDAVLWFVNDIFPDIRKQIPDARLIIAGHSPPENVAQMASHEAITVIADAADLAPLYQSSMLVVVPLLAGSGTRIKVLEAAAFGLPLVSTAKGVEGLGLKENQHAWITPAEPKAFALACIEALTSSKERTDRAKRLRHHVTQRYERTMITNEIANLILEQIQSEQNHEEAQTP